MPQTGGVRINEVPYLFARITRDNNKKRSNQVCRNSRIDIIEDAG